MNDHAVADQRMDDRRAGADRAIAADADPRTDHRAGRDQRAGADLGSRPDHRQRIDRDARFEPRRGMYLRAPAARPLAANSEDGRNAAGNSARATVTKARYGSGVDQHGKRGRRRGRKPRRQSGRRRRASWPAASRYFGLSRKLMSPAPARSSGAISRMRRSSGVSGARLGAVSVTISPTVSFAWACLERNPA